MVEGPTAMHRARDSATFGGTKRCRERRSANGLVRLGHPAAQRDRNATSSAAENMGPDNRNRSDAFIPYPTDRIVGTIDDAKDVRAAIEALSQAGFARGDIDVLHGEDALARLDPTGAEHGLMARFQRTLIRTA